MRAHVRFAALFLVATAIFAQRGGVVRGSPPANIGHATRSVGRPDVARINGRVLDGHSGRQRFGNGYFAPYYPFLGGYGDAYLPEPDYVPAPENFPPQPIAPSVAQAPPPIQTAHAVIQEYTWKDHGAAGPVQQETFTIALRDGSTRSAIVTWVQGRTLHYTDSDEKQGVLAADLIDRDTTRRLNREKKLYIQLPPA
jgi:hypothetical protein